ncbi:FtsX-like permease family protein [Paenibacillus segetis]|uniref:ABC transporter permease n=1 Tax=Paenibacillus segetis TaxID=1325360 RepID=A0ABQ1YEG3_9BACL|nr:FtsX-like permease family protein [Paenibacillus segetis]GGH21762.1 ABC transporter permease [Paenibacillus segetis]
MNIVNKLTIRHLKQNKRRTLVTIIGVIISVAMVTAVATLGISFMGLMQRQTIATEGEWHVLYKNVNKNQLGTIKNDDDTKALIISRDLGYSPLKEGQNENKPYLYIKEYNAHGFKQFPVKLNKGRLPQAADEVVISEEVANNAKVNYKIGDTLTLDIGERLGNDGEGNEVELTQINQLQTDDGKITENLRKKKSATYTVVGFIERPTWEPTWSPGYTVLSYVDENILGSDDTVNALVVLNKVKGSLFTHAEDVAKAIHIDKSSVKFNNELLRYYGVTNDDGIRGMILSLSVIIMTVIIIGSVSLIYNAFAISVSERARHLGMLSSVGATKRQKRNSVFFEGAIIGLISIPIGVISGLVGIGITFWLINSIIQGALGMTESLTVIVTPSSILTACGISLLTIFISTYLPARKASKISAIDAIRQTTDVKLTDKSVKTSKLIRKVFGIEAEIGLKNLKRNKRRYQATVFSLIISIVLFLTVSFFTSNLHKSLELSQDGVNYDIQVIYWGEQSINDQFKTISSLKDVTESTPIKQLGVDTLIDEGSIAPPLRESVKKDKSLLVEGKYPYFVSVNTLSDENLQAYAQAIGVNYDKLQDPEHLSAILIDKTTYKDDIAKKYVETKAITTEIGQSLELTYYDIESEESKHLNKVEVAALTDQLPMGIRPAIVGGLNIIVSESVMDQLIADKKDLNVNHSLYLKSKNPLATQQAIEEMKVSNFAVINVYQNRQQEEQMIMLMSVFTYGFIALITAISIANIFNTISTSITLRKREFAMLKSIGMTPKGFNKMINYESIFYGIKSLLYGLPISIVVMYLIYRSLTNSFDYGFSLPWDSIAYVIVAVFLMVTSAMLYSISKVKKENIIDALKQENI